jgi:predicted Zn-dependent peptidase
VGAERGATPLSAAATRPGPGSSRQAAGEPASTVLGNGLRIVELPVAGRLATAVSIAFAAGARHERPDEIGAAHFLEHMVFKGSEGHRSARELNRSAERLGTELNAQTTGDYVEFFSTVRAESAMGVIDLLTDITGAPLLEERHLESERAVILQEIADDAESPGAVADDRLIAALFGDHRLGPRTTGGATDIRHVTHAGLLAFGERQWSPEVGVVVIAGNLDHLDRARMNDLFLRIRDRPRPSPPPPLPPFRRRVEVEQRDSDVAHLRLAYSVPGLDHRRLADRAAAEVYSQLLGGPAGSRLFDELREQRGLCYAIDGYLWGADGGASLLSVDCSLLAANAREAYQAIDAVVADLGHNGPTEEEASRARSYAAGACALTFESITARADHALEVIMEYGDHEFEPMLHLPAIESVTRGAIAQLAARVVPGPCVGCVGPVDPEIFA